MTPAPADQTALPEHEAALPSEQDRAPSSPESAPVAEADEIVTAPAATPAAAAVANASEGIEASEANIAPLEAAAQATAADAEPELPLPAAGSDREGTSGENIASENVTSEDTVLEDGSSMHVGGGTAGLIVNDEHSESGDPQGIELQGSAVESADAESAEAEYDRADEPAAPEPARAVFADLGLSEPILQAIAEMGYKHPTPIQEQAIPIVLMGRDVLGVAQTGTGKTARVHTADDGDPGRQPGACPHAALADPGADA